MDLSEKRKRKARKLILTFCILTLGSGYVLYICLRYLLNELAKRHILVTLRADGEYKAIMRGNTCVRYVMKVENHRIDPDGFDTFKGSFEAYAAHLARAREKRLGEDPGFVERKLKLEDKDGKLVPVQVDGKYQLLDSVKEAIVEANTPSVFEEMFGVAPVGFEPYREFGYQYRWLQFGQEKAKDGVPSGTVDMFPRDERVYSLFHRYPRYGVVVEDTETGAGSLTDEKAGRTKVQVRAKFVFETETVNAQKTLFRTAAISSAGDWQQALVREIYDQARKWLGTTDWDSLVKGKDEVETELRNMCNAINGVNEDGLPDPKAQISSVRDYGQKVLKITMPQVNLQDKTLQQAYDQVFKAEKKRDADKATAEGVQALAAAPVLGQAQGLEKISQINGGRDMYIAQQLGNINVYAPGRDGLFLPLAESVTASGGKPEDDKKK